MFKKVGLTILVLFFTLVYTMPVSSMELERELRAPLESGYTEEGIYYEIFEVKTDAELGSRSNAMGGIEVTREVIYHATVNPPLTINHSTTISGMVYYGTLNLYKIVTGDGKTYAYYRGIIYPAISR